MRLVEILESQKWKLGRESQTAYFFNHAPWVAPLAYLHIVFKPVPISEIEENASQLNLPSYWHEFLSIQNGAILFSSALSIYGAVNSNALLNRMDDFDRQPFSILDENRSWPPKNHKKEVVIGGYGYDGSIAVLDKESGSLSVEDRKTHRPLKKWNSPSDWLDDELSRLSKLFDEAGRITVGRERTLPNG